MFLCAPEDEGLLKAAPKDRGAPLVELTYNWDEEKYGEDRYFGHLAYEVDDIYATCDRLMKLGITINRPPRDGHMAFVRSPDLHSIELLQKGDAEAAGRAVDLDAEHRPLVDRDIYRAALAFERCDLAIQSEISPGFSPEPAVARSLREEFDGGDDGTRNFALAAGRADTGDHSAVAVLRPLTG